MTASTSQDWGAHWRAIHAAQEAQMARIRGNAGDFWSGYSELFVRGIDAPDSRRDLIMARLEPGDIVLDIGAGAGRYAIPFAGQVREVIAVEPSPGMGQALTEEAQRRGIDNIRLVQSDWFAADVPRADVVVAAHVLYFTPEPEAFVRKLADHARRLCQIVLRVDQRGTAYASIFEEIWGEPLAPEPTFIDLYNLLYAMGIAADAVIGQGGGEPGRFASREQAEAAAFRTLAPRDDSARERIRAFLDARLRPTADGGLAFPEGSPRVALISWQQ